jgi:hypothetical protein
VRGCPVEYVVRCFGRTVLIKDKNGHRVPIQMPWSIHADAHSMRQSFPSGPSLFARSSLGAASFRIPIGEMGQFLDGASIDSEASIKRPFSAVYRHNGFLPRTFLQNTGGLVCHRPMGDHRQKKPFKCISCLRFMDGFGRLDPLNGDLFRVFSDSRKRGQ